MISPAKISTVLAAGALAFGAVACSSSDDSATLATTAPGGQASAASSGTAEPGAGAPSSTASSSHGSETGSAPAVTLDGEPVAAEFQPTRCKWETDEGHPQLEFDAGSDSSGGDLEVEIVMSDPPKLDDFALETGGVEWKATSADRKDAQITIAGDDYHVASQVTEDDGARTALLEAAFTCAK